MTENRSIYVSRVYKNDWDDRVLVDLHQPGIAHLVVSIDEAEVLANEILTWIAEFREENKVKWDLVAVEDDGSKWVQFEEAERRIREAIQRVIQRAVW